MSKAKELIKKGEYDSAEKEIEQLNQLFPNSKEISESSLLLNKINEIKDAKRKEEERIKALGFKALKEQMKVEIDYNTVLFNNITINNRFIHDSYGDRYFYNEADRETKYISMTMSVDSKSHNPDLPQLAAYSIVGDKMYKEGVFRTEFARWKDYGTYLGNEHDFTNDFSKVSTVRFKLGLQLSNDKLANPYAIVLMKRNVLEYHYERFENPPISYIGSANYPSTLSLEDFANDYVLVKTYNLK